MKRKADQMAQKASGNGGWSLRKALARRIAEAVNQYEKEVNRPADGAKKPAPAPTREPGPAGPAGPETGPSEADQA
jgi:hypothetical protein